MGDESKDEEDNFLTIQECFILHNAEPRGKGPAADDTAPEQAWGEADYRIGTYNEAWQRVSANVQAELDKLHQPFYQSVADRLSCIHYDSQLSYGPPSNQQGESTPPQLDPDALAALRPFQTLHSRLYTGLLLLGGVTPSDHSGTISELAGYLRERGLHVAYMSMAGGVRRGANEALKGLVKQLVGVELEAADVDALRAWHRQAANGDQPIVILLEDPEAADPTTLEQLVLILSEWRSELPIFLLLSATAATSLQLLLTPAALSLLRTEVFPTPPPANRLHAVVTALFFDHDLGFALSPPVLEWLYTQYFTQHATVGSLLGGARAALLQRCGSQKLASLDRFGGDRPALEKALRGMPVAELRAAARVSAGQAESSSKALVGRLSDALNNAWQRRRDMAAAVQFLYLACQATNFAQVALPQLHRWSARPSFFDDVTRHVSTAPSPLTLFDSAGVAEPEPEAIKGQGRRLVGMVTRGIREMSNEGAQRLVEEWREACRSDTEFLRQVQSELAEVSASWDSPESAPVGEPSRSDTNGGHEPAPKSPTEKEVGAAGAARDGAGAGAEEASGSQRARGGVEPALRSSPRRIIGAAGAARMSRSLGDKKREKAEGPSTNGGDGSGVRSSPRRVVGAAGAARQERVRETHNGGNGRNDDSRGGEAPLRSSPRRIVGAAGAARQEKANETQGGLNGATDHAGGVGIAVRSSPRRVAGAAVAARGGAVVGEKRKANGGRLSEDAERMQMMHRGQSAAEKRRKALSAPVVAKDPGDPRKDKLGTLLRRMVERFIAASQPAPLDELLRFDDVSALEQALSPPLRGLVQQALTSTRTLLPCDCCSAEGETGPTLHDTCTAYRLCAKFGDHVSITAWYEAFASVVGGPSAVTDSDHAMDPPPESSAKVPPHPTEREFPLQKVRGRGKPRKRLLPQEKEADGKWNGGEREAARAFTEEERATLQARFFQATAELQFLGLIRPSPRRSEHVQKVTC
ncbi:hypothetical protein KFL_001560010 [Klebsormidium nitens]|uniref:Uncharacterized protein n=1 Tax=Klebsormidium nitens TaxID=105231 RepID=A0A1Y1I369_KLENI|nr:hypothetical protein KFL_001560010 [Klebsormidium nitens]|eukprot:GAQ83631.1 hypothetical protein KFL_001560010 [Klebsormidium nitens]